MRLFAAVVPPPAALDHLERALELVRGHDDGRGPLRWTVPEDRHLTTAFYGEVPDGLVEELAEGLDRAAGGHAPFEVALRGAGLFDHRTLWVGCADAQDRLTALSAATVAAGEDLLGRADSRPRSRAHLTGARGRRTARPPGRRTGEPRAADVLPLVHALALYAGPAFAVEEVVLVASELGGGPSGHPRHEIVHRAALSPVAG